MNAKDIRSLSEAYMEVVENQQQLNEISDRKVAAVGRRRQANVDKSMNSNEYTSDKPGATQKLATNISKLNRFKNLEKKRRSSNEQVDLYDIILSHLLDEGYAETLEAAQSIMVNMSENWRESIMIDEGVTLAQYKRKREAHKSSQSGGGSSRVGLGPAGSEARVERDMETRGAYGTGEYGGTTKNPKKLRKQKAMGELGEQVDIYDIILSHLLDEGYAETLEAAQSIMVNMSENWRESIMVDEALTGERYKKVMKKPGGTAYSRKVSADPSKRATRGGKGGESDFGAGDRGSGNKAARRAGTYRED